MTENNATPPEQSGAGQPAAGDAPPVDPVPAAPAPSPVTSTDDAAPARPGRWSGGTWVEREEPLQLPAAPAAAERAAEAETGLHLRGLRVPLRWEVAAYVAICILALIMRLWGLGDRAIHHDESLHSYFSYRVYLGEEYRHNPLTHGMGIFHFTAGSFFLFGDSDFTARVAEALTGTALVLIPWLMRPRLGTVGALAASVMLAFSPALLYFSRFAREDIFMATWLLGVVAFTWRYLDEGKNRYLYGAAALLALGYATKETTFIFVAIMVVALMAYSASDLGRWVWGRMSVRDWGRPAKALMLIGGVSVPLFAPAIGFAVQKAFNITLVAEDGTLGVASGAPAQDKYFLAAIITVGAFVPAAVIGLLSGRKLWFIATLVFAAFFTALMSNFYTHPGGIASGVWQSLGYWLAQHNVKRGDQPWYYYFMLVHVYEFLPWLVSLGTVVYFAVRKRGRFMWLLLAWAAAALLVAQFAGTKSPHWIIMGGVLVSLTWFMPADRFVKFLVFWAGGSFLALSIAGEKMPWLLVHITVPLIILAARATNDLVNAIEWRKAVRSGALWVIPGTLVTLLFIYRLTLFNTEWEEFWKLWLYLAGIGLSALGLYYLARRIGWRPAMSAVALVIAAFMFVLTVRASVIATYVNADVPNDMLIYTQTSPALHRLVKDIERAGELTGERQKIKVAIDGRSGFAWPWVWYLRHYTDVNTAELNTGTPSPEAKVVIVHRDNNDRLAPLLADNYTPGRQFPHRWWFPEVEYYKTATAGEFFATVIHPSRWRDSINFFLYRKQPHNIGSEDAFVYFRKDLPLQVFE